MSYGLIMSILGWLIVFFGGAMLIPASVSFFFYNENALEFLNPAVASLLLGTVLVIMNRSEDKTMSHKDAFLLTFLTWAVLSLIGAVPIYLSGMAGEGFINALFESVSGLTTTGATVINDLAHTDHGILLWRSIMQWFGGMGVIVLATAIMPFLGVGGMQLYKTEMPGVVKDKLQPRLHETARLLWMVYLAITLTCVAAYLFAGMDLFDAFCHAFTTVSSGGFSTHDNSIAYFNSPLIEAVAMIFMFIGATNFSLHYMLLSGKPFSHYIKNPEFRVYLSVILVSVLVVITTLIVMEHYSFGSAIRHGMFNVVSLLTTTGYASTNYAVWPVIIPMLMIFLMFCGGCSGSTAGGMKILRVMMAFKQSGRELTRLIHPRGVVHVKISGNAIPEHIVQAVWSFAGTYVMCFGVIAALLAAFGLDLVTSFSAAIATLSSAGPGLGDIVGPAGNYATLPDGAKLVLCFSMILGRLEIFTFLVILTPAFWKR